LMNA